MEHLFADYDSTYIKICGAYKKLKSHVFFDKSAYALKAKISNLEFDRENFNHTLERLTKALVNQDGEYFIDLIENVDYSVLPKKFDSESKSDTIQGYSNHNQSLTNINFFIDMPIELYIVDFLWTLLLGKLTNKTKNFYRFAAATRFKPSLFKRDDDSLTTGIDFDSNRSFIPYFDLYRRWRNGAFKKIKKVHQNTSTILLCLDIKSFYYSVEFDFKKIDSYFQFDHRLESFGFLTHIMESIYHKYTNTICSYKTGIFNKKSTSVFPIGMVSTYVLREIYLHSFDSKIESCLQPLYYQRYVDDILLVLNAAGKEQREKEEIVKEYLVDTGIVFEKFDQGSLHGKNLKIQGYQNLYIQQKKINSFVFPSNEQALLLDVYEEIIEQNGSLSDMLPDFSILNSSFRKNAYTLQNLEISSKIRDIGFLQSNNYNATKYITSLLRLVKDTKELPCEVDDVLDQIIEFYKGSQGLEFSNNWGTIFELFIVCKAPEKVMEFYHTVKKNIDNITLESIAPDVLHDRRKDTILKKLKESIKRKLNVSLSMAAVHDPLEKFPLAIMEITKQLRESNLYNHSILSNSLENYLSDYKSLTDKSHSIFENMNIKDLFDGFRIKWNPRFIHLNEIYIAILRICIELDLEIEIDPEQVFNFYAECNQLFFGIERPSFSSSPNCPNRIITNTYSYNSDVTQNPKIALVNTKITEEDVEKSITDPNGGLTFAKKGRLFKIINSAREERANTIVFPEYYFPLKWLPDIARFVTKFNITLITGLTLIISAGKARNILLTLVPIGINKKYKTGLMIFREKNFYTPIEKISFKRYNLAFREKSSPTYYICDNGFYRFGTILCYEFTEICSRANYKEQIEVLFVPQLNKDTNYFSAIVESAARDLHCFIIQANTSHFGDSRITAPYKTLFKNILQIKGGDNDAVLTSTIQIATLKKARETFISRVESQMRICSECTKVKNYKNCSKCKEMTYQDDKIKDPAPNISLPTPSPSTTP